MMSASDYAQSFVETKKAMARQVRTMIIKISH